VRLRHTPRALVELDEVLTYIAERSPQGARRVQARIQAVTNLLGEHPDSGQPTGNPRLRRIVAAPYPYLIFYEIAEEEVIIIGVRHGARDPTSMPGGDKP
jgi:plasmid stabilization system protein ParE